MEMSSSCFAIAQPVRIGLSSLTSSEGRADLKRVWRASTVLLLFATVYYLTACASHAAFFQRSRIGLLWAPNALMVAALAIAPRRWWGSVLLAGAVAHILAMSPNNQPWRLVWQIAVNALFTTSMVNTIHRCRRASLLFENSYAVLQYIAIAVALSSLYALISPAFVLSVAAIEDFFSPSVAFIRWVLANVTPLLVLAPAVVVWATFDWTSLERLTRRRRAEIAVISCSVIAAGLILFGAQPELARSPWWLVLTFPPLIWAAMRLGPVGASSSVLAMGTLAMLGASLQRGPFVAQPAGDVVLSLHIYCLAVSAPVLLLGAATREREGRCRAGIANSSAGETDRITQCDVAVMAVLCDMAEERAPADENLLIMTEKLRKKLDRLVHGG